MKILQKEKRWNKALSENSNTAIARLDDKHRIMDINKKFEDKFGYSLQEIKGQNLDQVLGKNDTESIDKNLTRQVMEGSKVKKRRLLR